jgi:amino acid transporter
LRIDPIERTNLALCASAAIAAWWLMTPVFALSLGFGALLEAVNFRGLRRSAEFLSGLLALRFGLLVIGIGAALAFGADPLGLLLGLSLIMPAAIFEAWRARPPQGPTAPALAPDDPSWDRWNPWLAREGDPDDED